FLRKAAPLPAKSKSPGAELKWNTWATDVLSRERRHRLEKLSAQRRNDWPVRA
ncbi:hypothetical protein CSUI_005949, partial [Cystoisospora suis]